MIVDDDLMYEDVNGISASSVGGIQFRGSVGANDDNLGNVVVNEILASSVDDFRCHDSVGASVAGSFLF
jgi:hypothetical protein